MDLKDIVIELVKSSPQLLIMYYMLKAVLGYLKERDHYIGALHAEHLAARGESRAAIKENTAAHLAVVKAIQSLEATVRDSREHVTSSTV